MAVLVAVLLLKKDFLTKTTHTTPCKINYIRAKKVSVVALGAGGRRFESSRPDQCKTIQQNQQPTPLLSNQTSLLAFAFLVLCSCPNLIGTFSSRL